MAEQRGKLVTCDRCGESIFVKELKAEEKERDGGFTRWNEYTYENLPNGWDRVYFGYNFNNGMLCPRCVAVFEIAREEFWGLEKLKEHE